MHIRFVPFPSHYFALAQRRRVVVDITIQLLHSTSSGAHVVGVRWPRAGESTAAVAFGTAEVVVQVAASLPDSATETGVVALGKTFVLLKVTTSAPARVRLYSTAAYRSSDSARAIGTDPTGEHGCLYDGNHVLANLALDLSPQPRGSNLDTVRTANIYYSITNLSGSNASIPGTSLRQRREI